MEALEMLTEFIDKNLIYCLPWLVVTIVLTGLIFKNRFQTGKALSVVRWIIITYTVLSLLYLLLGVIVDPEEFAFADRATGPYKFAYWLMFLCAFILPSSLLFKRLGESSIYVLLVAISLKVGWYFEMFIIVVTSFHRDYVPGNTGEWLVYPPLGFLTIILQGVILGIILLGFIALTSRKEAAHNTAKRNGFD